MPNHVTNFLNFDGDPARVQELITTIKDDAVGYGTIDFNKIIPMPETLNVESGGHQSVAIDVYMSAVNPKTENMGVEKETEEQYKKTKEILLKYHGVAFFSSKINDTMSYKEVIEKCEEYDNYKPMSVDMYKPCVGDLFCYGKTIITNIETYACADWYEWSRCFWGTKWNAYDQYPSSVDTTEICFNTAWSAPHPILKRLSEMFPDIKITHKWADEDVGNNCGYTEWEHGNGDIHYKDGEKDAWEFAATLLGMDMDEYFKSKSGSFHYIEDMPIEISKETMDDLLAKGLSLHGFKKKIKYNEEDETYTFEFDYDDINKFLKRLDKLNVDIEEFFYGS